MNRLLNIKKIDWILIFLSSIVFIYVGIRAHSLSFTHDESLSFYLIKWGGYLVDTANNHYLNSVLMNFMRGNFGESEFLLRLPNVLSFGLYLLGSIFILKLFKLNDYLLILGFVLLVFNPYLLDYFSLARGYGISLGCMMLSLFFYLKNCYKEFSLYNFWFSMLFASIALGANLTMINFYLMIFGLLILNVYINYEFNILRLLNLKFILLILVFIVPIYLSITRLLFLSEIGQLFYGGNTIVETFQTLLVCFFYEYNTDINESNYSIYLTIITLLFSIVVILSVIYLVLKINRPIVQITFLILGIILAIQLENLFFEAKFPIDRTALFFYPLISLLAYFVIIEIIINIKKNDRKNPVSVIISLIVIPFFTFNLISNVNINHTNEWSYDADTKNIVKFIMKDILNNYEPFKKYTISSNWIISHTINYYLNCNRIPMPFVKSDGVSEDSDYLIEYKSIPIEFDGFEPIKHFPFSDFVVYKNTN